MIALPTASAGHVKADKIARTTTRGAGDLRPGPRVTRRSRPSVPDPALRIFLAGGIFHVACSGRGGEMIETRCTQIIDLK